MLSAYVDFSSIWFRNRAEILYLGLENAELFYIRDHILTTVLYFLHKNYNAKTRNQQNVEDWNSMVVKVENIY